MKWGKLAYLLETVALSVLAGVAVNLTLSLLVYAIGHEVSQGVDFLLRWGLFCCYFLGILRLRSLALDRLDQAIARSASTLFDSPAITIMKETSNTGNEQ